MTLAVSAFGTQYQTSDGLGNYTTVAEVTNVGEIASVFDLLPATHHQSPGARREFVGGLIDNEEFDLEGNYIPAHATQDNLTGLRYLHRTRIARAARCIYPTSPAVTLGFTALYPRFSTGPAGVENILQFKSRVKITGDVTIT